MAEYKKTLNLPETTFPMKADLVHKEPDMLKFWEEEDAFGPVSYTHLTLPTT